jgi:hypothetical protein
MACRLEVVMSMPRTCRHHLRPIAWSFLSDVQNAVGYGLVGDLRDLTAS